LIKFGCHPIYQVTWKSLGPINESGEKWATSAQRGVECGGAECGWRCAHGNNAKTFGATWRNGGATTN
jgi:hypothetical protein